MGAEGPMTDDAEPVELFKVEEIHFWGRPIDMWASARVGRISVFYTAGRVMFACGNGYTDLAWDVACDLYLPAGLSLEHGSDYLYCPACDMEIFYFQL